MKLQLPPPDKLIVTSNHDVAESRYYSKNPVIQRIYRRRLQVAVDFMVSGNLPKKILDIGCGSGVLTPTLQRIGEEVISVDVHDKLDLVNKNIPGNYVRASIFDLPFKEKFDGIVCLSVLEHLEDFEKALMEVKKHLFPGGFVVWGFPSDNLVIKSWLWLSKSPAFYNHINGRTDILEKIGKHYRIIGKKTLRLFIPSYYTVVKGVNI